MCLGHTLGTEHTRHSSLLANLACTYIQLGQSSNRAHWSSHLCRLGCCNDPLPTHHDKHTACLQTLRTHFYRWGGSTDQCSSLQRTQSYTCKYWGPRSSHCSHHSRPCIQALSRRCRESQGKHTLHHRTCSTSSHSCTVSCPRWCRCTCSGSSGPTQSRHSPTPSSGALQICAESKTSKD